MFKLLYNKSDIIYKKIIKNGSILLSGDIGSSILLLISTSLFARSVGVHLYGIYVIIFIYISIINEIFNLKPWAALVKYGTEEIKKSKSSFLDIFKYCFLADIFSMFIAFIIAFVLSKYFMLFFKIDLKFILEVRLLTFVILFKSAEIYLGLLRIWDKYKIQSIVNLTQSTIKLLLFVIIYLFSKKFEYFIIAIVITEFISMLQKFYYINKLLKIKDISISSIFKRKNNIFNKKYKEIFKFIFYTNFSVSIRMISRKIDSILIGKFLSFEILGLYNISVKITQIFARLTSPIYQVIYPEFVKYFNDNKNNKIKIISVNIMKLLASSMFIIYIIFAIFGKKMIIIAFSTDFIESYNITLFYFVPIIISIITIPFAPILQSNGYVKEAFHNQLISTLIYLVSIYPLIKTFGVYGAAISYTIFYISWVVLTLNTIKIRRIFTK